MAVVSRSIFAQDGFAWYFHMVLGVVSIIFFLIQSTQTNVHDASNQVMVVNVTGNFLGLW